MEKVFKKIKRRATTLEERIEIAKYCIEHDKDYSVTAQTYKVSYQQVYQWVRKYEKLGEKGLVDRRGKEKLKLTQEDKIERLRMENDFLKKLKELERRGF